MVAETLAGGLEHKRSMHDRADDVRKLIYVKRHKPRLDQVGPPEWECFTELATDSGPNAGRLDYWAINTWWSRNYRTVGYEIKISRADALRDINAGKFRRYLHLCNYFYFVVPATPRTIDDSECPPEAGLLIADLDRLKLRTAIEAPHNPIEPPTWSTTIALIRNARRHDG